jgi:hypothetical protein
VGQNPVHFGGCKWLRISGTLGVLQAGRIHQVLPRDGFKDGTGHYLTEQLQDSCIL